MMAIRSPQPPNDTGLGPSSSFDDLVDDSGDAAFLEEDLMAAMNAALEEEGEPSESNLYQESETSSLRSVDVMGEAMNLLLSSQHEEEDPVEIEPDNEEEINFDDFCIKPDEQDTEKGNNNNSSNNNIETTDGTNSPTSVVVEEAVSGDDDLGTDGDREDPSSDSSNKDAEPSAESETTTTKQQPPADVVPLKQFENALALIQDLENRILVLETDRQCLVEENNALKEETNKQATVLADMEHKLAEFPKLLETTVQEEAQVAAAKAEVETKISFWKKDMARQEREQEEEKRKKNRQHAATTDSLKQADFLKDAVDRKEQHQVADNDKPVDDAPNPNRRQGIFSALRGWRNNHKNSNNNNNNEEEEAKKEETEKEKENETAPAIEKAPSREILTSLSVDSFHDRKSSRPSVLDEDHSDEFGHEIQDSHNDENALDLMT